MQVHGLALVADAFETGFAVGLKRQSVVGVALKHPACRRSDAALHAFAFIEPRRALQFWVLVNECGHTGAKAFGIDLAARQGAPDARELLLALQQPKAKALLGVFHIALHRLLLTVHFFYLQVAQRSHDGRHEKRHCRQRREHCDPVLPVWREVLPPTARPFDRRDFQAGGQGKQVGNWHVVSVGGRDPRFYSNMLRCGI